MTRRRKTSETPMGAQLRDWAQGYSETGNEERAAGLLQAADYVDGELASGRTLPAILAPSPGVGERLDAFEALRKRVELIERALFDVGPSTLKKPEPRKAALPAILGPPDNARRYHGAGPKHPKLERGSNGAGSKAIGDPVDLSPCAIAILTVVARRVRENRGATDRTQAAIMAGYSIRSGGVALALQSLRDQGYVRIEGGKLVSDGSAIPGGKTRAGDRVVDFWASKVSPCAAAMLQTFVQSYPKKVPHAELCERIGYSPTSGGVAQALRALREFALVEGFRASAQLMAAIEETKPKPVEDTKPKQGEAHP